MNRILIVATHPDDEVLGCGGLIAKYADHGAEVTVLVVSRGIPEIFSPAVIEETREELKLAHAVLGVHRVLFLDYPAPDLDTVPLRCIASAVCNVIQETQPEMVCIPHLGDMHHDHQVTHEACLVACRPVDHWKARRVMAYETLSETDWAHARPDQVFTPTVFEDITPYLDRKIAAMSCYASQLLPLPSNRSLESIKALARLRGGVIGVQYAEAFLLIRDSVYVE